MRTAWTDLDQDGRRMNRTIKFCETMVEKYAKAGDSDLTLAYIDRLIKASHHKIQITDMVLGIKMIRKLAEKKYLDVIVEDKLKQLK